jgi:hypothetical protein
MSVGSQGYFAVGWLWDRFYPRTSHALEKWWGDVTPLLVGHPLERAGHSVGDPCHFRADPDPRIRIFD